MPWQDNLAPRLAAQFHFLIEIDKLKDVLRATHNLHNGKPENSAEHSWHLAMIASVLAEYANEPVSIDRVVRMLLIHDLVEIDAGDHPLHGDHDPQAQAEAEKAGADRLFGLLPSDQHDTWRALWDEFEAAESPDARFAKACDRFQPLICNMMNRGGSWPEYQVSRSQVEARVGRIQAGSQTLWDVAEHIFDEGVSQGWLKTP